MITLSLQQLRNMLTSAYCEGWCERAKDSTAMDHETWERKREQYANEQIIALLTRQETGHG